MTRAVVTAAVAAAIGLGVACAPSASTPPPSGTPAPTAPAPSAAIAAQEREVVERINAIRREHGLQTLDPREGLAGVARSYSCRMASQEFFAHVSPAGNSAADRVQATGISFLMVGENLAKTVNASQPVDVAVRGWMESDGHRENILREGFTQTGVGICRDSAALYFTQLFLRPA